MAQNKEERVVEIIVNGQRANASIKEMDAAVAVLNVQWRKMSQDDPGRGKLIAELSEMKAKTAALKAEVGGVSQTTGVMKQAFANAFALFTGGGIIGVAQQLFGFFKDSREESLASAKSSADLEATLKSTGQAAGLTADEIRKIGTERAKITLFDDDETNRASAMLLTFTNIKKGVFEEAVPAIQDLATKMGGDGPADLKGASIQVGKALNDPIGGIKALTRVGVTFNEQQKDQIKTMVKAGDTAGAQRLILNELNKEFGGSAEAARKAAGGMATLSMRWNEMKETVGGFVSEGLTTLSQWLGRVLDNSQPIVDIFVELGQEVASLWHDISDLVAGLDLFGEKGDSAVTVAHLLTDAITFMMAPLRLSARLWHVLIDGFIELYNKSELLRGGLGGLGAVVTGTFKAIKDDAMKYLGGVGDILIGIFTLDKDKIIKGFKSTFEATADLALGQGQRAAENFQKGYEANKNNHITRTVRVETTETNTSGGGTPAGNGESLVGESEKDAKARDAALKKRLAALEKQHKAEEEAERHHQEMMFNLAEAAVIAQGDKRKTELAAIQFDAMRKALAVTGSAQERAAAIALIDVEAHQKQLELQAKFDKEDADQRKEQLGQQLADIEANEVEEEVRLQDKFEAALLSERNYQVAVFNSKNAAFEAELALLELFGSKESAAYRKTYKEQQKLQKDAHKAESEEDKKRLIEKQKLAAMERQTASDVLQTTIDLLFGDAEARKEHHNLYVALAGAKLIVDGISEVAAIWKYSAENPYNGPTAGVAGAVMGGIQTALAIARTVVGLSKLDAPKGSFAKGGWTGGGMSMPGGQQAGGMMVSPMGTLMEMSGMRIGPNGKLTDNSGFAVAGIVHEDEYVVPKWMRADPQVAAVEHWLEARRLRGFADGGATGGSSVTLPAASAAPQSDGELTYAVLVQLLEQAKQQTAQLAEVKEWKDRLIVQLHLGELDAGLAERKQVQLENGIRA